MDLDKIKAKQKRAEKKLYAWADELEKKRDKWADCLFLFYRSKEEKWEISFAMNDMFAWAVSDAISYFSKPKMSFAAALKEFQGWYTKEGSKLMKKFDKVKYPSYSKKEGYGWYEVHRYFHENRMIQREVVLSLQSISTGELDLYEIEVFKFEDVEKALKDRHPSEKFILCSEDKYYGDFVRVDNIKRAKWFFHSLNPKRPEYYIRMAKKILPAIKTKWQRYQNRRRYNKRKRNEKQS